MKKKKSTNSNKYLKIIQQIENVRKTNNSNWMDLLRIAYEHNPKKTTAILKKILKKDEQLIKLAKSYT